MVIMYHQMYVSPLFVTKCVKIGGNNNVSQTTVSVHHTSTYRNPNHFKYADEFIPERWLGDTRFDSDKREALQPFQVGNRNCIGRGYVVISLSGVGYWAKYSHRLALAETRLILAKMIWTFDLELDDRSALWCEQKTYMLWEKSPLWVKIHTHQHSESIG
jgi:hypothetical protein